MKACKVSNGVEYSNQIKECVHVCVSACARMSLYVLVYVCVHTLVHACVCVSYALNNEMFVLE